VSSVAKAIASEPAHFIISAFAKKMGREQDSERILMWLQPSFNIRLL
jgi:hypothetical protein